MRPFSSLIICDYFLDLFSLTDNLQYANMAMGKLFW